MITYFLFSFKDHKNSFHFFIMQNSLSRLDDLFSVSRSLSSKTLTPVEEVTSHAGVDDGAPVYFDGEATRN